MFDYRDFEMRAQRFARIFGRRSKASQRSKNEDPDMDRMTKNVKAMGEHEYTRILGNYAKRLHPELTRERAFNKIFTEDSDEGVAIRKLWKLSKEADLPSDDGDGPTVEDDEEAMEELDRLAEEERRRSGTSKAVAFAKIYTDPANARLAQRERAQNRPR